MKILISNESTNNAHFFERLGLCRALACAGHEVKLWQLDQESAFDMFNGFEPDLFISQAYNLNRALIKCIQARPNLLVGLKAGDYGEFSENLDTNKYPVLLASKQEKENIRTLVDSGRSPDFIFIHYHSDWIEATHGYWYRDFNIPIISLMNAADIFDYTGGKYYEELASDVVFIGGYWPYKAKTLDRYVLPLCNPHLDLNVKIFGNKMWPTPNYCGFSPTELTKHIFSSAKICINVSELHSQDFGYDIIERPFKLAINKCFVVSDYILGLEKIYGNSMIYGSTPKEFISKIKYYLLHPEDKQEKIDRAYEITLKNHTYFDRAASIFNQLNLESEYEKMINTKNNTVKELGL
jgi:hypothetical protein